MSVFVRSSNDNGGPYAVERATRVWTEFLRHKPWAIDHFEVSDRTGWVTDRLGYNVLSATDRSGAVMTSLDEAARLAAEWNA